MAKKSLADKLKAREEKLRADLDETLKEVEKLPLESLSNMLAVVQQELKDIETERTDLTKPHLTKQREINGPYKSLLKPLEEAKEKIKGVAVDKLLALEEARQKALEAIRKAALAGRDTTEMVAALPKVPQVPGLAVLTEWVFTLVNLEQVDRRFLKVVLDEDAVREYLERTTSKGLPPELEGISFEKKTSVRTTGKKHGAAD